MLFILIAKESRLAENLKLYAHHRGKGGKSSYGAE
jgi:hypothetical protein